MAVGGCRFDGFTVFIQKDLFGFAAGADRNFHQTLNGGGCEVVERRNGDMEEEGKERHETGGPATDRSERSAVDMCPHDHEL